MKLYAVFLKTTGRLQMYSLYKDLVGLWLFVAFFFFFSSKINID